MKFNDDTVGKLLSFYRDDAEMISAVEHALTAFEKYHKSIFDLEIKRKLYACGAMEADEYREVIPARDKARTINHNALLTEVNILNRLAAAANLPPVYDGVVSEERPYRREVADAVLEYVRKIILERS